MSARDRAAYRRDPQGYIRRLVDQAPPLSEDQRSRLAILLAPQRVASADAWLDQQAGAAA